MILSAPRRRPLSGQANACSGLTHSAGRAEIHDSEERRAQIARTPDRPGYSGIAIDDRKSIGIPLSIGDRRRPHAQ
mgnify:CR=1 FL=1